MNKGKVLNTEYTLKYTESSTQMLRKCYSVN